MEPCRTEVSIVRKNLVDAEAAHDGKGHTVDNSRLGCVTAGVRFPSELPIRIGGSDKTSGGFKSATEQIHLSAKGPPGSCIATFEQHECGR
jgi:hypothetical protein